MESTVKLLVFLSCLGTCAPLCQIHPANSSLVERATRQLLGWMDRRSPEELNPSIYVGLRLSNQPSQNQDNLYLSSLMIHYQHVFLSHAADQHKPPMGQLALYLMAVRGGCKNIGTRKGNALVTQLKHYLEEEKHRIGPRHEGRPLTSYYQYSLAILALCIHEKKVPGHVVEKLVYAAEHDDAFMHQGRYCVDTAAMASLAFSCLQASELNPGLEPGFSRALKHVRDKILEEKTPEGYFGNIYSSPLALQALMEAPSPESESACLQAGDAVMKGLKDGVFQNPIPLSQLLPVLHQRTYLSLMQLDCNDERGLLEADPTTVPIQEPQNIRVTLRVQNDILPSFLHDQQYFVPKGATLQDVLIKAQEEGYFTYKTQTTLSGPLLTSVMDINPGERQYWQLLRAPDMPLLQGIANYRPQDGEIILLSLASW